MACAPGTPSWVSVSTACCTSERPPAATAGPATLVASTDANATDAAIRLLGKDIRMIIPLSLVASHARGTWTGQPSGSPACSWWG
ncbi:hypothetical protein GCM10029964_075560 [Kibdelosporangium lantanae]